jgi:hypothetical protein
MALPPPPGTMLDINPLVATGMAICRNITKPVFVAVITEPLVTGCKLLAFLLFFLFSLIQLSLVRKLDGLICALPRHSSTQ